MFEDRRKSKRVSVSIPIRVKGLDQKGNRFEEVTKSIDVSSDGACFALAHTIKVGTHLELSLPLPRHLQRGVSPKAVYETFGLVVRVENDAQRRSFKVSVKFRAANVKQYRAEL
ncbi:MAG: PilZ domain-containing protein [Acidobacteriota bacterium]